MKMTVEEQKSHMYYCMYVLYFLKESAKRYDSKSNFIYQNVSLLILFDLSFGVSVILQFIVAL